MRYALAVAALMGVTGCTDLGPELTDLEEARARWDGARPSSYVFAEERLCFCGPESRGPVRVRVQGTVAVERVYVDSGDPVPAAMADQFPTVDGLFDIVASALAGDAHEVRVTYDPVLGVPTDFWIDYLEFAADEELGMRVTEEVEADPGP
ncbi:MAG: hypothetical protein EXR91_04285 [Gemmatimonadetes bacterium]|nr:hypothetical protein [Gemmatimonadota bacterium]